MVQGRANPAKGSPTVLEHRQDLVVLSEDELDGCGRRTAGTGTGWECY